MVAGTTSACAENTLVAWLLKWICGNYLRVRGEYEAFRRFKAEAEELPPRARRILKAADSATMTAGTTSACAENTGEVDSRAGPVGNYLRVRGEY